MSLTLFLCFIASTFAVDVYQAIAVLSPLGSLGTGISGTVKFTLNGQTLTVDANITGITFRPDGMHGMHIHENGDLRGIIDGTGGTPLNSHFNPASANHSCPDVNTENPSHAGDLGNWNAVAGSIVQQKTFVTTADMTRDSVNSMIGRAVILHGNQDDCTLTSSSMARLAAGVVGVRNFATVNANKAAASEALKGVCVLQGTSGCSGTCAIGSTGLIILEDDETGVTVEAEVKGLTTERGFHVHEFGDLSTPNGASAGAHYNPTNVSHGLPPSNLRHAGDLGTIKTFDASGAYYRFSASFTSVLRVSDFIGRAMVIHELVDRGLPPSCSSVNGAALGAAGGRHYWCVIGIASPNASLPVPNIPNSLTFNNVWTELPCTPTPTPTPPPTPTPTPTPTSSATIFGFSLAFLGAAVFALWF